MRTTSSRMITGKYLSLTTFRPDGTGVATPVWFVDVGGQYLVETDRTSYKVKRIKRNPSVAVAACTASGKLRGEATPARAELLPQRTVADTRPLFAQKYRLDLLFIGPVRAVQSVLHLGRQRGPSVIVSITPEAPPP